MEWADKYQGRFDDGWDVLRADILPARRSSGDSPDCELTARHAEIPAWEDMRGAQTGAACRQMEVYAGFLEYTDHHVAGSSTACRRLGVLDDTLVFYIIGDNGASAEGTPTAPTTDAELQRHGRHQTPNSS